MLIKRVYKEHRCISVGAHCSLVLLHNGNLTLNTQKNTKFSIILRQQNSYSAHSVHKHTCAEGVLGLCRWLQIKHALDLMDLPGLFHAKVSKNAHCNF